MTRRKFIKKLIGAGSLVVVGAGWLVKKTVPLKYVRALKFKKYPGSLKSMSNIPTQGKWSG